MDDPQLCARNLAEAAQRSGAEFLWNAEVASVSFDKTGTAVTGVVLADGSRIDAPVVVNAAGPHSALVHRMAFGDGAGQVADDSIVASRPLRVEVAVIPAPPGVDLDGGDHPMPWIADNDLGVYFRPQFPNQLLVGGSEPECDNHSMHFLDHPRNMEESLSDDWTNYVYRLGLRVKDLPIPNSPRGLVAMYDASDDWLPIYDKSAVTGWYNLRGTSGNQFKNAPVVGKVIKEIIEACERGHDHDTQPVQLNLERTGQTLNCGVFSRLRQGSDTTGTVLG
jgi:sarcosine oxidase subunit beta